MRQCLCRLVWCFATKGTGNQKRAEVNTREFAVTSCGQQKDTQISLVCLNFRFVIFLYNPTDFEDSIFPERPFCEHWIVSLEKLGLFYGRDCIAVQPPAVQPAKAKPSFWRVYPTAHCHTKAITLGATRLKVIGMIHCNWISANKSLGAYIYTILRVSI